MSSHDSQLTTLNSSAPGAHCSVVALCTSAKLDVRCGLFTHSVFQSVSMISHKVVTGYLHKILGKGFNSD